MNAIQTHRFRITVERMDDAESASLTFEVRNQDDIFSVVERVSAGTLFAASDAVALVVGLKLLTGVMLHYCNDPIFADLQPAVRTFIGNLKSRVAAAAA